MFRRKKSDGGFEWQEYVRTTVLVRRQARRQRVKDASAAAGQQMRAAGVALGQGSLAAGGAAVHGVRAGAGALVLAVQAGWTVLAYVVRTVMRPIVNLVARPSIGGPLGFAGAIALGAGIGRARAIGLDHEAGTTLAAGLVLIACLMPMLVRSIAWRPSWGPSWDLSGRRLRLAGFAAAVLALAAAATWYGGAGLAALGNLAAIGNLPSIGSLALVGASEPVTGSGYALAGDRLRIADKVVRLSDIEAPEPTQRCRRGGRSWRCGAAARAALGRLVNGRRVSCTLSGSDAAGRPLGHCTVGQRDVGAELVRRGHVFAAGGFMPRYAGEERAAREDGAGLWSGEAERPAEYRARIWEEAKGEAPDGCPIKGNVGRSGRVYVLPWERDYPRTRVTRSRGDRWFCSEEEAVAAGFRASR